MKLAYEIPLLQKCCCIIPIRASLAAFATLKIVADLVGYAVSQSLGLACIALCSSEDKYDMTSFIFISLALILDISFMVILIVGVCKKSNPLYRLSYYYSIVSLIVAVGGFIISIIFRHPEEDVDSDDYLISSYLSNPTNLIIFICIITAYTLIHIYMILLMKSEMIKTQNVSDDRESIIKLNFQRDVASNGRFQ